MIESDSRFLGDNHGDKIYRMQQGVDSRANDCKCSHRMLLSHGPKTAADKYVTQHQVSAAHVKMWFASVDVKVYTACEAGLPCEGASTSSSAATMSYMQESRINYARIKAQCTPK